MNPGIPRIAITPGEPAGIGPDLVVTLARQAWPAQIVAVADADMLRARAEALGDRIEIQAFNDETERQPSPVGRLLVQHIPQRVPGRPGVLDPANASYVLATLEAACEGCLDGRFSGMVTGPVHKGVINDAGIPFSGHTEFLAAQTASTRAVMLLIADDLRVALLTTHLALRDVPDHIDGPGIESALRVLNLDLQQLFGIKSPRIAVLGLNPHAGESGHLGSEEQQIIAPALERLREENMDLVGPLPADTAFTPKHLNQFDAVLAMYHDQGLPVLKHHGFGRAVNVTLGLPIVRTSVDHGTALDLAGTGTADVSSLQAALALAIRLSEQRPR